MFRLLRCLSRGLVSAGISLVLLCAAGAWGATTGKISGRVTDADGAPLVGVAVNVDDTRLGATTDADGRYFILRVPPGEHSVRARLIGFGTVVVTGLLVNADLTTEANFELPDESIEISEMVVVAQRPPIEADVTLSLIHI